MTRLISSRLSILRTAVVVAALLSLCVSSNVGPCFLPLPALENYTAENLQQPAGATASRSHSTGSASFRIPMAQAQKREPQAQPFAVLTGALLIVPISTRVFAELSDAVVHFKIAQASQPSGRAPPRLV